MRRVTSGALIQPLGHWVVKVGEGAIGDRVGAQGAWLEQHQVEALPCVMARWDRGYIMERLEPIRWDHVDWTTLVRTILSTLHEDLWRQPAEVEPDHDAHLRFVWERCEAHAPEVYKPLERWHQERVADVQLAQGLTHGDPTFDNTCRRPMGSVVLIDPNPARAEVPSYVAADVGNILQSLHGYERIKYGRPQPQCHPVQVQRWMLAHGYEQADFEAARYFCAVKYARLLAYETTLQPVFREVLHTLLRDEGYM